MKRFLFSLLGVLLSLCSAGAVEWLTNVEQAQQLAAAEGKAVLVDFTGTDWCVYCREMHRKVLDTPAFEAYAAPKFVCVEMDLPHKPLLPPEQLEYNRSIVKRYGVTGYPTLLVLNAAGEVTGGFIGGKAELGYVREQLEIALQNAQDLPRLEQLQGEARVRALKNLYITFRGLEKLGTSHVYRKLLLEADKENVTGIQTEEETYRRMEHYRARLHAAEDEAAERAVIEEGLATEQAPELRVELLNRKVQLLQRHVDSLSDLMEMKAVMLESARQLPEHAEAMEASVEATFRDPDFLLQLIREQRKNDK